MVWLKWSMLLGSAWLPMCLQKTLTKPRYKTIKKEMNLIVFGNKQSGSLQGSDYYNCTNTILVAYVKTKKLHNRG